MKVLAINGSPKKEGNTYNALSIVLKELECQAIETELIHIGNKTIKGCIACKGCTDGRCVFNDDEFDSYTQKMYDADGIILGSPVYYAAIAGTMKSFLDRAFYQSQGRMRLKVGASVAVARRSGGMPTFEQLNNYFLISEMVVAPSYYWNAVHGGAPGDVLQDKEGVSVLTNLARNMAWLLKMKDATKETVALPEKFERAWTNFVR